MVSKRHYTAKYHRSSHLSTSSKDGLPLAYKAVVVKGDDGLFQGWLPAQKAIGMIAWRDMGDEMREAVEAVVVVNTRSMQVPHVLS